MKPRKRSPLILGVLLLLAAPVLYFGSGVYVEKARRLYRNSIEFRLYYPETDAPQVPGILQKQRELFLKMGIISFEMKQSASPDEYSLTAIDRDPIFVTAAVISATGQIAKGLQEADRYGPRRLVIIREPERPPPVHWPNIPRIMWMGLVAAVVCGIAGGSLIVKTLATPGAVARTPDEPPLLPTDRYDY
jgi:hypothetical protein